MEEGDSFQTRPAQLCPGPSLPRVPAGTVGKHSPPPKSPTLLTPLRDFQDPACRKLIFGSWKVPV